MDEKTDQLYLHLKGIRERACRAQMLLPAHWRTDMETVVNLIDDIGAANCPKQWSHSDRTHEGY